MRYFVILLASAASLVVPSLGSAADYTAAATKLCTDAFGRRGPCPATVAAGSSIGETAADLDPLLVGGGLLAAGGVAAGALIASPRTNPSGVIFLSPPSASP